MAGKEATFQLRGVVTSVHLGCNAWFSSPFPQTSKLHALSLKEHVGHLVQGFSAALALPATKLLHINPKTQVSELPAP